MTNKQRNRIKASSRTRASAPSTTPLGIPGVLAAALAHEIGNVLTPAAAYLQLAANRPHDEALTQTALAKANAAIESVTALTRSMLGQTLPDEERTCELRAAIDQALDGLRTHRAAERVSTRFQVSGPERVCVPAHAMQQILLNLVLNAAKAMESHGGTLEINSVAQSDGMCLIRVIDTGPGLPEEITKSIFEPFSLGSDSGVGLNCHGLGLAIVRHLVEQYAGEIRVESTSPEGTCFAIRVPLAPQKSAQAG